jgi:hypothetical protein
MPPSDAPADGQPQPQQQQQQHVWGFTAHILLQVAKAALRSAPAFDEYAPGQPPHERMRAVSAL